MEKRASELIAEHVLGASSVREWRVGYETGTGRDPKATRDVSQSKAARGHAAIQNISKRQYIAALQKHEYVPESKATRGRVAIQNIRKRCETHRTPKGRDIQHFGI